jgi:hypothetical protein
VSVENIAVRHFGEGRKGLPDRSVLRTQKACPVGQAFCFTSLSLRNASVQFNVT